jgi:phosphomannomutase
MAGTKELYRVVIEFLACGGIEVTASRNPVDYDGIKVMKSCPD